jgi:hypothetical protein
MRNIVSVVLYYRFHAVPSYRISSFARSVIGVTVIIDIYQPHSILKALYSVAEEFENKFLKRIFVPKGEEAIGKWRNLHNEGLHNLYS